MSWTTPRTWVAGELVTAAELNTHIRDDLSWLRSAGDWTYIGASGAPAYQNGWTSINAPAASYKRIGNWVCVRGYLANGTAGTTMFTMPYWPTLRIFIPYWGEDSIANEQLGRVDVDTSGNVVHVTGANTAVTFSGVFSVL